MYSLNHLICSPSLFFYFLSHRNKLLCLSSLDCLPTKCNCFSLYLLPDFSVQYIYIYICILFPRQSCISQVSNSLSVCSYHYRHLNLAGSLRVDHSNSNYKRTHCPHLPPPAPVRALLKDTTIPYLFVFAFA